MVMRISPDVLAKDSRSAYRPEEYGFCPIPNGELDTNTTDEQLESLRFEHCPAALYGQILFVLLVLTLLPVLATFVFKTPAERAQRMMHQNCQDGRRKNGEKTFEQASWHPEAAPRT